MYVAGNHIVYIEKVDLILQTMFMFMEEVKRVYSLIYLFLNQIFSLYRSGVDVKDPSTSNFTGDGGRCPPGFYCPRETAEPQPCLPGTYLSTVSYY